jgi:hypothetical protein
MQKGQQHIAVGNVSECTWYTVQQIIVFFLQLPAENGDSTVVALKKQAEQFF